MFMSVRQAFYHIGTGKSIEFQSKKVINITTDGYYYRLYLSDGTERNHITSKLLLWVE
jgi:hypothetical protein